MKRITFGIPDDLHERVTVLGRKRGLNLGTTVEQALRLWEGSSPENIGLMAGPLQGMNSKDRKVVVGFCELLGKSNPDIRSCVVRRVRQFLAIVRDEYGPPVKIESDTGGYHISPVRRA